MERGERERSLHVCLIYFLRTMRSPFCVSVFPGEKWGEARHVSASSSREAFSTQLAGGIINCHSMLKGSGTPSFSSWAPQVPVQPVMCIIPRGVLWGLQKQSKMHCLLLYACVLAGRKDVANKSARGKIVLIVYIGCCSNPNRHKPSLVWYPRLLFLQQCKIQGFFLRKTF